MIKRELYSAIFLLMLLAIPFASSLIITEVESNPLGTDAGNEWIEFYNKEEINFNDYKIINNDGNEIILNGSFSGYFVYKLEKQWLDNSNEKIYLYKDSELIDETNLIDDIQNNDKTWQLCSEKWEFKENTKEEKNCQEEIEDENEEKQEELEKESQLIIEEIKEDKDKNLKEDYIMPETIKLIPKDIKSNDYNDELNKNKYGIYGFIIFCILLVFLFVLKRINKK